MVQLKDCSISASLHMVQLRSRLTTVEFFCIQNAWLHALICMHWTMWTHRCSCSFDLHWIRGADTTRMTAVLRAHKSDLLISSTFRNKSKYTSVVRCMSNSWINHVVGRHAGVPNFVEQSVAKSDLWLVVREYLCAIYVPLQWNLSELCTFYIPYGWLFVPFLSRTHPTYLHPRQI